MAHVCQKLALGAARRFSAPACCLRDLSFGFRKLSRPEQGVVRFGEDGGLLLEGVRSFFKESQLVFLALFQGLGLGRDLAFGDVHVDADYPSDVRVLIQDRSLHGQYIPDSTSSPGNAEFRRSIIPLVDDFTQDSFDCWQIFGTNRSGPFFIRHRNNRRETINFKHRGIPCESIADHVPLPHTHLCNGGCKRQALGQRPKIRLSALALGDVSSDAQWMAMSQSQSVLKRSSRPSRNWYRHTRNLCRIQERSRQLKK
jgi:hypothetical protein